MLEWARSRYDWAFDHYLRKPIQEWTPQVQVEFEAYVRNTERIEFWGQVTGWTGVAVATCALPANALELHMGRRILVESRLYTAGTTRIIQIRPEQGPPWFGIDYHTLGGPLRGCKLPHIDFEAWGIKHWPWDQLIKLWRKLFR
jgi:hypothetical protein